MRHLETYRIFEAKKAIGLNTKQIAFLNKYVKAKPGRSEWIVNYSTDPPTVEVFSSIDTKQWSSTKTLKSLQNIHFGKIREDFILDDIEISTFEGFPKEVGRNFKFAIGAELNVPFREFPEVKIGGTLELEIKNLDSLEGCPEEVGNLTVSYTKILDMTGCPKRYANPSVVNSRYGIVTYNKRLISLEYNSRLISLEGLPKEIDSKMIEILTTPMVHHDQIPKELLIQGFEDFQKTGTWIPYYLTLKLNTDRSDWDEEMKIYLDSKITPETIQEFIDSDPSKAAIDLKGMWTEMKQDPRFSEVKFPESHSRGADLLADLSDVGL